MHGKPAATGVTYIAGAEVLVHADILVLVLGYCYGYGDITLSRRDLGTVC